MPEIRFGTASFAYEGWKGLVYHERYRAATFKVECLREYAQYAPFRIVEFDFPFYRPPSEAQLARFVGSLRCHSSLSRVEHMLLTSRRRPWSNWRAGCSSRANS